MHTMRQRARAASRREPAVSSYRPACANLPARTARQVAFALTSPVGSGQAVDEIGLHSHQPYGDYSGGATVVRQNGCSAGSTHSSVALVVATLCVWKGDDSPAIRSAMAALGARYLTLAH